MLWYLLFRLGVPPSLRHVPHDTVQIPGLYYTPAARHLVLSLSGVRVPSPLFPLGSSTSCFVILVWTPGSDICQGSLSVWANIHVSVLAASICLLWCLNSPSTTSPDRSCLHGLAVILIITLLLVRPLPEILFEGKSRSTRGPICHH